MHNDLLDTILVTQKDKHHSSGDSSPARSSGASTMNNTAPSSDSADACPVDHKTREIWLAQARAAGSSTDNPHGVIPNPHPDGPSEQPAPSPPQSSSWAPWTWFSSPRNPPPTPPQPPPQRSPPVLDTTRTISSIPRSSVPGPSACPAPAPAANSEIESGSDKATGNWIYPSERMFFDAMRRKGFSSTTTSDMKTVVPIHNAVNERAWAEIKGWEAPYAGEGTACGEGPRLYSFAGVKERMTPKARINTLLGYAAPFDRHDWVVDRCGKRVEYVIDFYGGRSDTQDAQGKINFYLDVRPKLNSWEGVKMRVLRGLWLA